MPWSCHDQIKLLTMWYDDLIWYDWTMDISGISKSLPRYEYGGKLPKKGRFYWRWWWWRPQYFSRREPIGFNSSCLPSCTLHIIMQCILNMILLQERVFPVALTEGATLLPSLLLLLIFVLLSCVLLTILIIRGRWKLFYFLSEHIYPTGLITPMKSCKNFDYTLCHSRSRRRKRDKQLSNGEQINFHFWKTGLNSKFGSELKDANLNLTSGESPRSPLVTEQLYFQQKEHLSYHEYQVNIRPELWQWPENQFILLFWFVVVTMSQEFGIVGPRLH